MTETNRCITDLWIHSYCPLGKPELLKTSKQKTHSVKPEIKHSQHTHTHTHGSAAASALIVMCLLHHTQKCERQPWLPNEGKYPDSREELLSWSLSPKRCCTVPGLLEDSCPQPSHRQASASNAAGTGQGAQWWPSSVPTGYPFCSERCLISKQR